MREKKKHKRRQGLQEESWGATGKERQEIESKDTKKEKRGMKKKVKRKERNQEKKEIKDGKEKN